MLLKREWQMRAKIPESEYLVGIVTGLDAECTLQQYNSADMPGWAVCLRETRQLPAGPASARKKNA